MSGQLSQKGTIVEPSERIEPFIVPLCSVFRQHLKSEQQKFTPERAQVLDVVIQMDRTFEADDLQFGMRKRGMKVSKATIYRTLKLLLGAGIIEQILFDKKQAHYRLAYGQAPLDQMVCVETGLVVDFSEPELIAIRDRIAAKFGWTPVGHRMRIFAVSRPDASSSKTV